jgi:hypothetical protein
MKCQKCLLEFEEKDIDLSHDVPKYMGGTDSDGRHYLCKKCHTEYELEILRLSSMILIKTSSEEIKKMCMYQANIVKKYFFKKNGEDNDTSTITEP